MLRIREMFKVFIFTVFVVYTNAKQFTKCELVKELEKQGFPKDQMRDWVCLIEAESSRRTGAIGGPDDDGSYDHGLFQINDRYWCNNGSSPGKDCHVRCADVRTNDITKASKCAKKIYSQQGFDAWVGWVNECKGKRLPDLGECTKSG